MSYVFASPEWVAAAASDLASIGSTINSASAAAAAPTSAVMAAGADDVSAVIAALFGAHAQAYQQLSAQAAMFHEQFVQLMSAGANLYAGAEAANATPMQQGAAPSNDVAMATAAAAQSMNTGAANRIGAAVGAARSGASLFGAHAAALAPAGGSAGLFGNGGGGAVGALGSQAGVTPAADVAAAEAAPAQAFAPGFFGPGAGFAAANAQPAKAGSESHPASPAHVPHAEPAAVVAEGERSGWLHGEGASLAGHTLRGADSFFAPDGRGVGLFGHSAAGGRGALGEAGIAAPA
ncbi:MAG: PE family protein [Mycobacterium sp.]|nr:MAG: PE family protein [Mycobacterium sp.]